ncbi:MAG: YceD family protein [Bacteroidales bacterium]
MHDYIIPITSTKEGLNQLEYSIDKSFLEQFNYRDIMDISAKVYVNLYKSNRLFDISLSIKGEIKVECDRCLDEFMMPVSFEHHIIIKAEDHYSDENDEVVYIPESSTELDLAPYVFETIVFSIPMRKVHSNDSDGNSLCNQEMISKLNKFLINESDTDPRWDTIKEMLN